MRKDRVHKHSAEGLPRLVIVGRPNVGKSTLFNRLYGRRRSLVHDLPGVTRDRIEEQTEWMVHGRSFPLLLVDTGGVGGDRFAEEIEAQVRVALAEADVVIALFDAKAGCLPADQELIRELGRAGVTKRVPLIGVVNKVDAESHEELIADFYTLGLSTLLTISAEHGRGINDLEEAVVEALGGVAQQDAFKAVREEEFSDSDSEGEADPDSEVDSDAESDSESEPDFDSEIETDGDAADATPDTDTDDSDSPRADLPLRLAIVGRPNVGKSTLINSLLGEKRMITSPIAGTTVDAVDSAAELDGKSFLLIDTAGIRRKGKTEQGVEVLAVVQARKALERAEVAVLLLDGETGITDQDEKIGGLIEDAGCGVILAVNKWDTQAKNRDFTRDQAAARIRGQMAYLKYAPIVFLSALKGQGLKGLGDLASEIVHQRRLKIPTHDLTEWVRAEAPIHNPKAAKFYLCHQAGRHPPTFVCHVNDPERVHFSLRRHLLNALRARWGFMGSPVRLLFVRGQGGKK